jgi:diguanylate cyclase (GGDEF)-like protein
MLGVSGPGATVRPGDSGSSRGGPGEGLSDRLLGSVSLRDSLCALDLALREIVGYHAMAVYLPHEERLSAAYAGGGDASRFCPLEIAYGRGVAGMAAATRAPILNCDLSEESGPGQALPFRSVAAVPLDIAADLTGVLALYHADKGAFHNGHLRVLLAIRALLARLVAMSLTLERTEHLAEVDPLTALPNRRALFLRLDGELARCRRKGSGLAVLVCRLEGMEDDPDRLDDAADNRLLRAIASGLRRVCREDDCVARMGGEFVLVLSDFSPGDLEAKRELIARVASQAADGESREHPPIARLGAAFYPEDGAAADARLNVVVGEERAGERAALEQAGQIPDLEAPARPPPARRIEPDVSP